VVGGVTAGVGEGGIRERERWTGGSFEGGWIFLRTMTFSVRREFSGCDLLIS
jgi:hypothetical protein